MIILRFKDLADTMTSLVNTPDPDSIGTPRDASCGSCCDGSTDGQQTHLGHGAANGERDRLLRRRPRSVRELLALRGGWPLPLPPADQQSPSLASFSLSFQSVFQYIFLCNSLRLSLYPFISLSFSNSLPYSFPLTVFQDFQSRGKITIKDILLQLTLKPED